MGLTCSCRILSLLATDIVGLAADGTCTTVVDGGVNDVDVTGNSSCWWTVLEWTDMAAGEGVVFV